MDRWIDLSNRPHFRWVYWRDKPRGVLGATSRKKLVNHSPSARDSQVLSTSQVVYHAGKPTESVVYCFYKTTMSLPAQ